MGLGERICGAVIDNFDPDDILGYTSVRRVKIRDRRLGLMYLFTIALIIAYVVGFNIYFQQLYRKQGDLLGSVSLTLNAVDPSLSLAPANTTFCGTGPGATSGQGAIPFARQPCSYLDPLDSVYPSTEVAALFVATRISRTNMTLPPGCDEAQSSQGCSFVSAPNSTSTSFVADVEMSTLQLEHLFTVPQFGLSRPSVQMAGALLDVDDNVVDPCEDYKALGVACPPDILVGVVGRPDKLPLRTLLRAAGLLSLDAQAGSTPPLDTQTLRWAGFVLLLTVRYSNYRVDTGSMDQEVVTYTYEVDAVPDLDFRGMEVLPEPDAGGRSRTVLERHGIRLLVRQTGTVGVFDLATLLLTVNTAVGLLALAKFVVDFVSTTFLPARAIYRQYMTVRTADFSDLDALPRDHLKRFEHEDLVNVHPSIFGRVDNHGHIHTDVVQESELGPDVPSAGAVALRLESDDVTPMPPAWRKGASVNGGGRGSPSSGGGAPSAIDERRRNGGDEENGGLSEGLLRRAR